MKTVYVTVAIHLEDDVDTQDFFDNTDYSFDYEGVIDTEIIGATDDAEVDFGTI